MDLPALLAALRKRWFVLVVLAVIGAGFGYYQTSQQVPQYRSTSRVFVSLARADSVAELVQGSTYTQNLIASFAELATQPVVLDPVIQQLGLNTTAKALAGRVQADAASDVVIIDVSASSPDPAAAAAIANAVSNQLSKTVSKVTPSTTDGGPSVEMTVIAQAEPAKAPYAPSRKLGIGTPGLLGLLLGFVIAILWSRLDTRVRTADDFPGPIERPVLGQIPHDSRLHDQAGRAIISNPHGGLAESYRRLRTNLQFVDASAHVRSFVVTSSIPGEGKSTTALNHAFALAEKNSRVLLVDADLRRPSIALLCGLEGAVGLSTVLVGEATIADVAHRWGVDGLHVVPAGGIPPNPSQLVDSDAMVQFLETARQTYDVVVLDTPPVLALADAGILARRTDGAVVVAGSRKVHRAELAEALNSLESIGVTIIGLVANGVRKRGRDQLYGYDAPKQRRRLLRRWSRRPARTTAERGLATRPVPTVPGPWRPGSASPDSRSPQEAPRSDVHAGSDAGGDA